VFSCLDPPDVPSCPSSARSLEPEPVSCGHGGAPSRACGGVDEPEPGRNSTSSIRKTGAPSALSSGSGSSRQNALSLQRGLGPRATRTAGPASRVSPGDEQPSRACPQPAHREESNRSGHRGIGSREDRQGHAPPPELSPPSMTTFLFDMILPKSIVDTAGWCSVLFYPCSTGPSNRSTSRPRSSTSEGLGRSKLVGSPDRCVLLHLVSVPNRETRRRPEPCARRALKKRTYWVKNCANFHSNRVQFCDGCRALPV
jgi:hypothetical protein